VPSRDVSDANVPNPSLGSFPASQEGLDARHIAIRPAEATPSKDGPSLRALGQWLDAMAALDAAVLPPAWTWAQLAEPEHRDGSLDCLTRGPAVPPWRGPPADLPGSLRATAIGAEMEAQAWQVLGAGAGAALRPLSSERDGRPVWARRHEDEHRLLQLRTAAQRRAAERAIQAALWWSPNLAPLLLDSVPALRTLVDLDELAIALSGERRR